MYEVLSPGEVKELQRLATMTLKQYPIDRSQLKADLREKIRALEE